MFISAYHSILCKDKRDLMSFKFSQPPPVLTHTPPSPTQMGLSRPLNSGIQGPSAKEIPLEGRKMSLVKCHNC